jgi:hypothetical protein
MIIRLADVRNEAEQVLMMARDFISRLDNGDFLPEEKSFEQYVIEVLSLDHVEVIVAEHDGKIVAGMGMAFGPFFWNPGMIQAEELFWWASPDAPKTAAIRVLKEMLRRAIDTPFEGKTVVAFKKLTSSPEGVGALYERMGLKEAETNYVGVF